MLSYEISGITTPLVILVTVIIADLFPFNDGYFAVCLFFLSIYNIIFVIER